MKAALYVRVSTAEQRKYGMSVDSQIDALKEYCSKNKYDLVDVYNDAGKTATKYKNRHELLRMFSDCRAGKVDLVLFTRLDRFFRDVEDYYDCMKLMNDTPWIAIWEPDYRTDTAAGKFNVNLRLALAQHEAEQDSERIKAVKKYQKAQGHYMGGNPPLGYVLNNKMLVFDADIKNDVRSFFEDYIGGYSMADCVDRSAARGLLLTRSRAYRMLRSEYYYSSDDAYISPEEHSIIEYRLSNVKVRQCTHQNVTHVFQGIVFCGYCGYQCSCSTRSRSSLVRGDYNQKVIACHHNKTQYYYEPCTGKPAINEEILENLLLDKIESCIDEHNANINAEENMKNLKSIQKQIENLNQRLNRLKSLFELGDIELDEYKSKRDKLRNDINALDMTAANTQTAIPPLSPDWKEQYSKLDDSEKRDFWHRIIKKVHLYKNREIKVEL